MKEMLRDMKTIAHQPCLAVKALTFSTLLAFAANAVRAAQEITYPAAEFTKLDTFEGLSIEDADKFYGKKDYKSAFAEYQAYSEQFPKGKALPYAVLRMGRCKHLMKKRGESIRFYEEVVDYFPNDVRYAAGALFYLGLAHRDNGDEKKCLATWARMVKDKAYVQQANSGEALNYLAAAMDKAKEYEEAVGYRKRIAIEFRKSNPGQAHQAKDNVRYHYVVRMPNHQAFKTFYQDVGGFWGHKGDLKDLENNKKYWDTVFRTMGQGKHDTPTQLKQKRQAVPYWAKTFGDKMMTDDHMRIWIANLQRFSDRDDQSWVARINKQAATGTMSTGRLIKFIDVFKHDKGAQNQLISKYGKHIASANIDQIKSIMQDADPAFSQKLFQDHVVKAMPGMKRDQQMSMVAFLSSINLKEEAIMALNAVNMKAITDPELVTLAKYAGDLQGEGGALGYFSKMKDKKTQLKAKYDWYKGKSFSRSGINSEMAEKMLSLIDDVARHPEWAEETKLTKAMAFHRMQRFPEAISAYKAWGKQPDATWKVADCLVSMKNYPKAITTVKALESVGGGTAVAACMKVADIYKISNNKTKEIEQLRLVLHRYPNSGQSSQAHQRLEAYGAKVTGGKATVER